MMANLAQQVTEAKSEAEEKIFKVIMELNQKTGLCVDGVSVYWVETTKLSGGPNHALCDVEISLKG